MFKALRLIPGMEKIKQNETANAKDLDTYLAKASMRMENEHTKRWSTSFLIRDMLINVTVRYHCPPTRMTKMKKN